MGIIIIHILQTKRNEMCTRELVNEPEIERIKAYLDLKALALFYHHVNLVYSRHLTNLDFFY